MGVIMMMAAMALMTTTTMMMMLPMKTRTSHGYMGPLTSSLYSRLALRVARRGGPRGNFHVAFTKVRNIYIYISNPRAAT